MTYPAPTPASGVRCTNNSPLLSSPCDRRSFACSAAPFPLTLTLSLREREQQASDRGLAEGCWLDSGTGVVTRLRPILPLPKGEGLFSAPTENSPGARDLSRRKVAKANPGLKISRRRRQ